jgi:hypothetical protein
MKPNVENLRSLLLSWLISLLCIVDKYLCLPHVTVIGEDGIINETLCYRVGVFVNNLLSSIWQRLYDGSNQELFDALNDVVPEEHQSDFQRGYVQYMNENYGVCSNLLLTFPK